MTAAVDMGLACEAFFHMAGHSLHKQVLLQGSKLKPGETRPCLEVLFALHAEGDEDGSNRVQVCEADHCVRQIYWFY